MSARATIYTPTQPALRPPQTTGVRPAHISCLYISTDSQRLDQVLSKLIFLTNHYTVPVDEMHCMKPRNRQRAGMRKRSKFSVITIVLNSSIKHVIYSDVSPVEEDMDYLM